LPANIRLGRI